MAQPFDGRVVLTAYTGVMLTDSFHAVQAYVERVLGRPVVTHELGSLVGGEPLQAAIKERGDIPRALERIAAPEEVVVPRHVLRPLAHLAEIGADELRRHADAIDALGSSHREIVMAAKADAEAARGAVEHAQKLLGGHAGPGDEASQGVTRVSEEHRS